MKALVHQKYGSPDVLALVEREKPVPKDSEVRIRVYATTVNRTDCGTLRGTPRLIRLLYGLFRPKATILGNEFAGKVDAVGEDVTSFTVDENVFGFNDTQFGAHAEYMVMSEDGMMASMPAGMTYAEAAPTAEGAHYALCYIRKAQVRAGQRVLINGATGAIGSAAVQLVKYYGANVTAVCDGKHEDLVKSLGADCVIDYTRNDFTKSGQEYDFVFDAVGKSSFGACKRLLKPGGMYCSSELGFLFQNPFLAVWTSRIGNKRLLFPIPEASKEEMVFLKELVESRKLKPVVDRRYPLEQIVEAFTYVETGRKVGNVVITLDQNDNA